MAIASDQLGNAAKRLQNATAGPWVRWKTRSRHGRAIRFIESYCAPAKGYRARRPLKLAPFQKGWLEDVLADGVTAAAMSLPRGNGKSTFLAAVGVWATFDPDPEGGAPQVPVVATTVGQAIRAVYGVGLDMVRACDELERRALVFSAWGTMKLFVPSTGGEMFPVSNDVDGLQGLDPSLAICDELGFMPVESWDSLLLATGKRPRSLVVGIGTPGLDKANALWHLRRRVKEGVDLPGFRFTEYAAPAGCPIEDRSEWRKANPALAAGYKSEAALATALAMSEEGPFRIFHLGQWVDGVDCWLGRNGLAVWDALADPFEFVAGADTWVGVDAARTRDSTAVAAVQRRPDGRLHVKVRIWVPQTGEPTDPLEVMSHIQGLALTYRVVTVSYDPKFFDITARMLEEDGVDVTEIPQSHPSMTPIVGSTYELIKRGLLSHDGDELVTTQVLNAVPRYNAVGFILDKFKSRGRIDAGVAICLAVDRALRTSESRPLQVDMW